METVKVNVVNNSSNELPKYADFGCSGCDARADIEHLNPKFLFNAMMEEDHLIINPGGRALIPTGIHVAIPNGYEIQVRPRSGLALKNGISCTNSPGTIDASYRGDVGVILENRGSEQFIIHQGDRIAQFVLMQVPKIQWNLVETLDETERGEGGFNSTGVK